MSHPLVQDIRIRAKKQRLVSWGSLLLILAVLVAGVWFFTGAGDLTLAEARRAAADKEARISMLSDRERSLSGELLVLKDEIANEVTGRSGSGLAGAGPAFKALKQKELYLENEIQNLRRTIASQSSESQEAVKPGNIFSQQFINSIFIRVLVVMFIAFLVQLLASQYRYTLRMASHLEAVADALSLLEAGEKPEALSAILKAISPSSIDFTGKSELNAVALAPLISSLRK